MFKGFLTGFFRLQPFFTDYRWLFQSLGLVLVRFVMRKFFIIETFCVCFFFFQVSNPINCTFWETAWSRKRLTVMVCDIKWQWHDNEILTFINYTFFCMFPHIVHIALLLRNVGSREIFDNFIPQIHLFFKIFSNIFNTRGSRLPSLQHLYSYESSFY